MADLKGEQGGLSIEEANSLVKEQVDRVLGSSGYQHGQVNQWTASIVDQSIAQLTKLNKPYKYIVTCAIMQKTGAGLHLASACYWDNTTDITTTIRWENKTMYCVVTVYASAI